MNRSRRYGIHLGPGEEFDPETLDVISLKRGVRNAALENTMN
jgi:hypothetical protein